MVTKKYTCINCPMSCEVTLEEFDDGTIKVTGNTCPRGEEFAKNEYTNPMRMLTTTVKIDNGNVRRLPVISDGELPKSKMKDCLAYLYGLDVKAPVSIGTVIAENICGTGVNMIASRAVPKV